MNLLQQAVYNQYAAKDLWLQARLRNKRSFLKRASDKAAHLAKSITFRRGQPARPAPSAMLALLGRTDNAIGVDLSKYEAGTKLKPLYDAGVRYFTFRMGGPTQWVYGNWNLEEDPQYRSWFEEAKTLGSDVRIGGYYVYSAGVDDANYETSEILLTQIDRIMHTGGNYQPDMLWIDDEVNHWFQNGGTITVPGVNQVHGIRVLTTKCWKNFHVVTGHYSANWFMRQSADYITQYQTWLDNANKPVSAGGQGTTIPTWDAYYPALLAGSYASMRDFVNNKVGLPTSTALDNYLSLGYSIYDLWQCAGDFMTPWGKVDISMSRQSAADFDALFNLNATPAPVPTPTPTPAPIPTPGGGLTHADLEKMRFAMKAGVDTFIDDMESVG